MSKEKLHNVSFKEIIDRLRDTFDYPSYKALSEDLGINYNRFNVLKHRDSIPYKTLVDFSLRKKLLNLTWLLTGEGETFIREDEQGSFVAEPPSEYGMSQSMPAEKGLIPVVGITEAGPGVFSDDAGYPIGISDEMLSHPHGLKDQNAFGVLVTGESMIPKYEPGDRVIVSPSLVCKTGQHAVIGTTDGRKLIAKIRFNGGHVHLIKYNADDMKLHKKDMEFCYPIVWVKEKSF
ncbi:helix-turn-helix domain-containing protein [Caldithrix abyssi]|nr:helix-turn-helix domain-containing protein [Caldithrix abyssi]